MDTFTERNWEAEVLRSPVPVVVSFWAEWCVPCQLAAPALLTAEEQSEGRLRFGLVDYDTNPTLAERYKVAGLPTLMIVKDGKPVLRRVGLMGRAALQDVLRHHVAR